MTRITVADIRIPASAHNGAPGWRRKVRAQVPQSVRPHRHGDPPRYVRVLTTSTRLVTLRPLDTEYVLAVLAERGWLAEGAVWGEVSQQEVFRKEGGRSGVATAETVIEIETERSDLRLNSRHTVTFGNGLDERMEHVA